MGHLESPPGRGLRASRTLAVYELEMCGLLVTGLGLKGFQEGRYPTWRELWIWVRMAVSQALPKQLPPVSWDFPAVVPEG